MTICLVKCPSPFLIDEWSFPPLGLMSVGAGLVNNGHDVIIHDDNLGDIPLNCQYYGFGPTSPEYSYALCALKRIKEYNKERRVVIGGPHATLCPNQCLKDGFDCVVIGDGEIASERAFFGKDRFIIADELPLEKYPFPDRTLIDLSKYSVSINGIPATTIMGSRGCPFRCGFCCKNYSKARLNSALRVIEEIKIVNEQFGYNAIMFPEDIFILNRKRTEAICNFLKHKNIIWRCLVRGDLIVRYGMDFVRMMKDAGCVSIGIGVESGSDKILQTINKGETVSIIKTAIKMFQDENIFVKGFFIIGLPGENKQTIAKTEKFLDEMQLDDIDCKPFQPYPGSPIYDHKDQYDISWKNIPLKDTFYKGHPGEYRGTISTSALSTKQIMAEWERLENKYKKWDEVKETKYSILV